LITLRVAGNNVSIYSLPVDICQQPAFKYASRNVDIGEKLQDDLLCLTYVTETHTSAPVAR